MGGFRRTTESFIKECKEIHDKRRLKNNLPIYDYSKTKFTKTANFIIYNCSLHGDIRQRAMTHLLGHEGCKKCAKIINSGKLKYTTETFIQRAKEIHDSKRKSQNLPLYDYSKTEYIGAEDYVVIKCPIHGEFKQLAHVHLSGSGCVKCANSLRKVTKEQFIYFAKKWHDNYRAHYDLLPYNYNKLKFVDIHTKCKDIFCPHHGYFNMNFPSNHIYNAHSGCPECGKIIKEIKALKYTNETFIQKAKEIHDSKRDKLKLPKYNYSKTKYIHSEEYVTIICPLHGEFKQLAYSHITGKQSGCPQCANGYKSSKFELEVQSFLDLLNIKYKTNDRKILGGKELDIYIPEKQLALELDGLHWHSDLFISESSHLHKTENCEKQGIQLIHIFEDEWLYKQSIVESRIQQIFGMTKFKIPARKCYLRVLETNEEHTFFENNHLQGYTGSSICYGLFYNEPSNNKDYLVSAMSFHKQLENNNWELLRFCNLKNFRIIGGASKIFKQFIKKFEPKIVVSYADRRWSIKNENILYEQLSFKFDSFTKPNYFYVDNDKRINICNLKNTEYECASYPRIYDCGSIKYIWKTTY